MTSIFYQLAQTCRLTARHFLALPLILALPVLAEAAQHIVEFKLGMFASVDGIQPGKETNIRMVIGGLKVMAILFATIVMVRFFLHDRNSGKALQFSRPSRTAVLISILFTSALVAIITFAGPMIVAFAKKHLPFIPASVRRFLPMLALIAVIYPFQKKTFSIMAAILDDTSMSAAQSEAASRAWMRDSWLTLLVAVAPAMVLHYFLNSRAVDASASIQLTLLTADCLVVGVMAVLIAAATFITYQEAKQAGQGVGSADDSKGSA